MNKKRNFRFVIATIFIAMLVITPQTVFAASKGVAAPAFSATAPMAKVNTVYVAKGDTLKITGKYPGKGDKVKSYKSSKKSVATINSKGKLKALKTGTTTVTVTTKKGKVDTIQVKVVKKSAPAKKITLPKTDEMVAGQVIRLSAKTTPDKSTSTVKWTSSNKKIATVDAAGYITAKKKGTVKITATTSSGKKATTKIKVVPLVAATAIAVDPVSATMQSSNTKTLKAYIDSGDPASPTNDVIVWSSSNEKVATVTEKGKVTAIRAGTASITARAAGSGIQASAEITVQGAKIEADSVRITPGERFKPKFTDYGLSSDDGLIYASSNDGIASVTPDGYVQAAFRSGGGSAKSGTVTITATDAAGVSASIKVTVSDEPTIVDLSKWQKDIDWSQASRAFDLAILRVTYGADASYEPMYKTYADNCTAYGVPYGAYSFALYKSKGAAIKEANAFYKQATAGGRTPLFFVLDVESSYIKRAHTEAYISRLRELAAKDGISRLKVGVYVGHHLYNKLNLNLDTDPDNGATPDFVWIPRYNTPNNGTIGANANTPDYPCDMWQYSSGAYFPGIAGKVDVSTLYDPEGDPLSEKGDFSFDWLISGPDAA
ncbi:MAG: Ig-like domain-containing protein [Clostridiales Family XIII bacterium]|jgi:uncharacterized protein YjdB|nr:Ig-like domain-containing protein [Clostridiales Family XIII bacterium]